MTTYEVGKKLVELCKQGQWQAAKDTLYSPDIISVEAGELPESFSRGRSHAEAPALQREIRGAQNVTTKGKWWADNHTVHTQEIDGPYPHGDRFAVRFKYDMTNKPSNVRLQMDEIAVYTVGQNGKIVREEFFYLTAP